MSLPDRPDTAPRLLERRPLAGWLGGVCAGIGSYLGVPPLLLRTFFVLLGAWRLTGVIAYFLVWLIVPLFTDEPDAPGIAANTRSGLRAKDQPAPWASAIEWGQLIAVGLVGAGATWLVQAMGWGMLTYWFVAGVLLSAGLAVVWWQADHASPRGIRPSDSPLAWLAPLTSNWTTVVALAVGLACIGASVVLAALRTPLGDIGRTLAGIGLALAALLAAAAPWALRVRRALAAAREAKLLSDARADMAAHLHDSVLQTLALIQKQAQNPREVIRLARRQERALRAWLYDGEVEHATLAAALKDSAQEVEDDFPVAVELVTVGDADLTPALGELARAAREAMVNAAKHSGASTIDVYAEVDGPRVEVFVRDRGRGFDPDAVPEDRLGVRRSIMERMARHGGTARVRSNPETGTEVTLEMTA